MPKSRHRKNHKKKVEARRKRIESQKRSMQNEFSKLLKTEMEKRQNNNTENIEENVE